MIRTYTNKKIYKNSKVVKVLSIFSMVFAFAWLLIDLVIIIELYNNHHDIEIDKFLSYHIMSLCVPFLQYSTTRKPKRSANNETKFNNDFLILLLTIILSLFPLVPYILYKISGSNELVYLPNILILIADVFLIHNCVLIKREWKENPPRFAEQKYAEKARQQHKVIYNQNKASYHSLIEKCGIKFFIKYYKQIKRLPLRDVEVVENYGSAEREERLLAAKKIIDSNLVELALTEILKSYGDVLNEAEIEQAKSILAEFQASNNKNIVQPEQQPVTAAKPLFRDDFDN